VTIPANPLKAILWDFDGTIVFFNFDAVSMRSEVFGYLQSRGYTLPADGQWRSVFKAVQEAREYMLGEGYSDEEVQKFAQHVEEIVNTFEVAGNEGARLVPGVVEVVRQSYAAGLKQAIITLNRSENVRAILEQFQLDGFFEVIAGRDTIAKFKPDPAHPQYIIDQLGVQAEECLMIGDHPQDLETAQNAGITFVAVVTERHNAEEFSDATYFVSQETMLDLLPIVRDLSFSTKL